MLPTKIAIFKKPPAGKHAGWMNDRAQSLVIRRRQGGCACRLSVQSSAQLPAAHKLFGKLPLVLQAFLLTLLLSSQSIMALENQLASHPSPYLAMHAQDPVHWQDWHPGILEQAKKEGKLLFISSGYFACHWCHVMRRESYNNKDIANLLNQHFIPVKLDRELEPAMDAHLIDFVQRTQGRAGWPLNVFVTPQGYPLVGMTYVPAEKFRQMLVRLNKLWTEQTDDIAAMAQRGMQALVEQRQPKSPDSLVNLVELKSSFISSAMQMSDQMQGGFGQSNKFPMTSQLSLLLELQASAPDKMLKDFLILTLDRMANDGLRDQLAGGFYRYTVDPGWQTPHYEKMLYTQALLSELYMRAATVLERPDYQAVATDTLNFVLRDMRGKEGAYIASFSAVDGNDEEGGYYLWSQDELSQVLQGEMLELARKRWRLQSPAGEAVLPMQGSSISELAAASDKSERQIIELLDQARQKLLAKRIQRVLPKDDKELAGWNGLLLATLSTAAKQPLQEDMHQAAKQLRDNLLTRLWDGNKLLRARDGSASLGSAALEDYAYVAYGISKWAELPGNEADKLMAQKLLTLAWDRFYTEDGWRATNMPPLPGMPLDQAQEDGALPSPSALVIQLSLRAGNRQLKERALATRGQVLAVVQDKPFWYAGHIQALLER
jgi:uncharacterized protein YyaL (SSP411 family)